MKYVFVLTIILLALALLGLFNDAPTCENDLRVIWTFYVHEDDSISDVYMIEKCSTHEIIGQYPAWSIGKDLG